jgi:S-(hydroxymethyl)glutathione dehydrogenase/alcohol dehydrogenase
MGAALAGANPIVAVDVVAERLAAARSFGATHVVDAANEDVPAAIAEIRPGGIEWAVEAIGRADTLAQAFESLRPGGTVVAVGLGARDASFSLPLNMLVQREKRVVGSLYGSANPLVDVPRLLDLYRAGRLPIDRLVGQSYALADINQAFDDLIAGGVGRGVVRPGAGS